MCNIARNPDHETKQEKLISEWAKFPLAMNTKRGKNGQTQFTKRINEVIYQIPD